MVKLKALKDTWLKARPDQSSTMKPHELIKFPGGRQLAISDGNIFEDKGGHFKVVFKPPITITLKGVDMPWTEGYIYGSHWEGLTAAFANKTATQTRFSPAGSSIILQPAPLFIQNDNKDWADDGSASNLRYGGVQCGLTSASMLIASVWPNAKVKQLAIDAGGQFEDWVAGQFKKIGAESTSMEGHVAVLQHLGFKAYATRKATIGDLKQALHLHPVILGTAYKASGHFVCGVGVADKPGDLPDKWPVGKIDTPVAYPQDAAQAGVLINDPYGQRDYSGSGNQWVNIAHNMTDTFGLHNVLTNSTLERFWVDGGEESGWAVFLVPSTPNAGNRAEKPTELAAVGASKTVTSADIDRVAKMLGCETRALKAVMEVEAGGGGFLPDGRAKILFEAHWFGDYTGYQYNDSNPNVSSKGWNRDLYIGGAGEWDRFAEAAKLDRKAAIKSCSWGLPQLMGGNAIEMNLGYADEEDFYNRMMRSEGDQLEAMGRFIKADPKMLQALKTKDWAEFAYRYNGEGYAANNYDVKLADAYDSLG